MDEHEDTRLGVYENEDRAMNENDDDEFNENDDSTDSIDSLSPKMDLALTELASRLCAICQSFCRGEMKLEKAEEHGGQQTEKLKHHPSLSSLRESVDAGCPLCKNLAQSFEERLGDNPELRDTVADSWFITCYLDIMDWSSMSSDYNVVGLCFHFTFYDRIGHPVEWKMCGRIHMTFYPAERVGLGPEYSKYAAGANSAMFTPNTGLARSWFDMCLDDHDCRDEVPPKFLPTRLIEVRTHGGTSSNTEARLCEAEDFSADASYLTLSHCWGGNTIFTLTKSNIQILKRDIPVHQLPDLFKDALHMTSELGMKYIWIDCLCILQDCQDDWAHEAARMGDVYRYAKCNVAASGYKNGKTGLLKERTPLPLQDHPLFLDLVLVCDKETIGFDARKPFKGIYVRADDREFYDAITKGPLNSRGWVAQERALSPAILHFTPKQMWWECRSHIANEALPYIDLTRTLASASFQLGPDVLRSLSTKSDIRHVYQSWTQFVSFYARTNLTVESDRFPALNGIAQVFGEITEDNLIAGLWEGDLIKSLSWTVIDDKDRAKKIPCTQRAPSWSWAFLCIPHDPGYYSLEGPISLCTCRRILSDDPGFRSDLHYTSFKESAVRGLEITGPLRKLPVKVERLMELSEWKDCVKASFVHYDVADSSFFSAEDVANPGQAWHWEEPRHILPLIIELSIVKCLLLSQVPGAEHSNTFRRLGLVNFFFRDNDSRDIFLGKINGNGKSKLNMVFEVFDQHDLVLI